MNWMYLTLIVFILLLSVLADPQRIDPKAVVPRQQKKQDIGERVSEKDILTTQPTLYTSSGYIVRIHKSLPTGNTERPQKPAISSTPIAPTNKPSIAQPSPSPVYPVKRPETTVYPMQPPRPTLTIGKPSIDPSSKPTNTPPDDEDNEEDGGDDKKENNDNKKTTTNGGETNKPVQSGDPWGDFVFPTRGPRPEWMRNESSLLHITSAWPLAIFLILPLLL